MNDAVITTDPTPEQLVKAMNARLDNWAATQIMNGQTNARAYLMGHDDTDEYGDRVFYRVMRTSSEGILINLGRDWEDDGYLVHQSVRLVPWHRVDYIESELSVERYEIWDEAASL